ncbi:hypothetical protein [Bacillus sp. TL12]|uniref:hypothetical protein n=1 Tax=Bacillus sp. TL12 TaxID=2894756 RepID=UPI001F527000|nr:hypothetical protein [Bacillus sp. TL12]MCI0768392.1 hypothetical protein [Bacillus sp. TL12]
MMGYGGIPVFNRIVNAFELAIFLIKAVFYSIRCGVMRWIVHWVGGQECVSY